jgi:hypothetical protein
VDALRFTPALGGVLFDQPERWTREKDMPTGTVDRLLASDRVMLALGATVTDLQLAAGGNGLAGMTLAAPGKSAVIVPKAAVLAGGGLET